MRLKRPLPESVANWINTTPGTATEKQHFTRLSAYIIGRYLSNGVPFDEPLDISREHFRNNCGTGYLQHLQKIEQAGLLLVNHNYTPGLRTKAGERITLGQCKQYQFAPQYVFEDPQIVSFTSSRKKQFENTPIVRQTVNCLQRLRLTFRESQILPYLRQLVTAEYIRNRCKVNDEIEPGNYTLSGMDSPRSLDYLQSLARRNGCDLIVYRERAFLDVLSDFIKKRRATTTTAYLNSLIKLKNIRQRPNVECKRNDTNYRLDTNLTNLKSELLQFLKVDGEHLVSIDLANSQPLLLAHLMQAAANPKDVYKKMLFVLEAVEPKTRLTLITSSVIKNRGYQQIEQTTNPLNATKFVRKLAYLSVLNGCLSESCEQFMNLTKSGIFYEELARNWPWGQTISKSKKLEKKARNEVKTAMFVALFAAARYNPPAKKLLNKMFPGVVHFTNSYKRKAAAELLGMGLHEKDARKAGKRALAITLQQIESAIFIDGILARLLGEGFTVFSKHDSILCKASDLAAVNETICAELDSYLGAGGYSLKIEHHRPPNQ